MIELDSGRGICYNVIASHGCGFCVYYTTSRELYHHTNRIVACELRSIRNPLAVRSSVTTGRADFV
jgi:hypothetical protein